MLSKGRAVTVRTGMLTPSVQTGQSGESVPALVVDGPREVVHKRIQERIQEARERKEEAEQRVQKKERKNAYPYFLLIWSNLSFDGYWWFINYRGSEKVSL